MLKLNAIFFIIINFTKIINFSKFKNNFKKYVSKNKTQN